MNLSEIKSATNQGEIVCWKNRGHEVVKTIRGEFFVLFIDGGSGVGLTTDDGVLQGLEGDFFKVEA